MITLVIGLIIGLALGAALGAYVMFRMIPSRYKHHVDYRERWQSAVQLLGAEGRLSDEQTQTLTGVGPTAEQPAVDLHKMSSWDRRDVELERARAGLPPLDDLRGMASWDVRDVMKARSRSPR